MSSSSCDRSIASCDTIEIRIEEGEKRERKRKEKNRICEIMKALKSRQGWINIHRRIGKVNSFNEY